jgi:hypothetical protein
MGEAGSEREPFSPNLSLSLVCCLRAADPGSERKITRKRKEKESGDGAGAAGYVARPA